MKDSQEWYPDLIRYHYRLSLRPHPLIGLNKFDAGRLHQARSGKSYLRAHPAWGDDRPTTCPRCCEAPETLEHAVFSCPAREPTSTSHFWGLSDLGPDTPVWCAASLFAALAGLMTSTLTAFSAGMFSHPTSVASSLSSSCSAVVSFAYFMSSQDK